MTSSRNPRVPPEQGLRITVLLPKRVIVPTLGSKRRRRQLYQVTLQSVQTAGRVVNSRGPTEGEKDHRRRRGWDTIIVRKVH